MKPRYNPALVERDNKKKKGSDKKVYIITALVFLVSIVMFYISIYLNSLMVLQEKEVYASINITDRGGFDVNTTALTFGKIRPGDSASRSLVIENNYTLPIIVEFSSKGNISRFLKFEKENYLMPGANKTISFAVVASADESYGFYDGSVKVVFKRAS